MLAWLSILAYANRDENRNLLQQVAHKAPGVSWLQSLAFIPSLLVCVGFSAREGEPGGQPGGPPHAFALQPPQMLQLPRWRQGADETAHGR